MCLCLHKPPCICHCPCLFFLEFHDIFPNFPTFADTLFGFLSQIAFGFLFMKLRGETLSSSIRIPCVTRFEHCQPIQNWVFVLTIIGFNFESFQILCKNMLKKVLWRWLIGKCWNAYRESNCGYSNNTAGQDVGLSSKINLSPRRIGWSALDKQYL